MIARVRFRPLVLCVAAVTALVLPAQAEVVEEIVAWVNGAIITKTELESEEQLLISDAYSQFAGDELDREVEQRRKQVLINLIDRKVLVDFAKRTYNVEKMTELFYDLFKEQQKLETEEEVLEFLAASKMTMEELREQLLEMAAPEEVLRSEVVGRLAVSESEIDQFYAENPAYFRIPGEVTIREIVLLADSDAKKEERRADANEIRRRAVSGDDFDALARELSEAGTREEGGLLGPLRKGELSSRLEEVAFNTPVGEVSEVLENAYGFHIVKVETRSEDSLSPLEEVRDRLRLVIEQDRMRSRQREFVEKLRGEAEWCVKKSYRDRVPFDVSKQNCESL